MDNSFSVQGSSSGMIDFMRSSIRVASETIEHYDFVINDISSQITNKNLQDTKAPALAFLESMRKEWLSFKIVLEGNLRELEKK